MGRNHYGLGVNRLLRKGKTCRHQIWDGTTRGETTRGKLVMGRNDSLPSESQARKKTPCSATPKVEIKLAFSLNAGENFKMGGQNICKRNVCKCKSFNQNIESQSACFSDV